VTGKVLGSASMTSWMAAGAAPRGCWSSTAAARRSSDGLGTCRGCTSNAPQCSPPMGWEGDPAGLCCTVSTQHASERSMTRCPASQQIKGCVTMRTTAALLLTAGSVRPPHCTTHTDYLERAATTIQATVLPRHMVAVLFIPACSKPSADCGIQLKSPVYCPVVRTWKWELSAFWPTYQ